MASFNKVILVGNMVENPELKQTKNGISVTSFRIAVGRRFAKDGDQQADFINVVAWRQTAEFVTRYFCKGKGILVCGSLQTRTWVDNNNVKRYVTEVVADEATFVEKKNSGGQASNNTQPDLPNYTAEGNTYEDLSADDELPF